MARKEVCNHIVFASLVPHSKPVGLQRQVPTGNPRIKIPHAMEPLQGPVVRLKDKIFAHQIVLKSVNGPLNSQSLFLNSGVASVGSHTALVFCPPPHPATTLPPGQGLRRLSAP